MGTAKRAVMWLGREAGCLIFICACSPVAPTPARYGLGGGSEQYATIPAAPPPSSQGRAAPVGRSCLAGFPIKGNRTTTSGEWIYHVPGGAYYDRTLPEECFATEVDAQVAGYRRSLR